MSEWTPQSWREKPARQQPDWPDPEGLSLTLKTLASMPPLVFAGEARELMASLGEVAAGRAFLLQAGDCAESFDSMGADDIREKLRVILQMAVVLTYAGGVPTVKVGRIAGQFAKPRSSDIETQGDIALPSFRGHIVNDIGFDADSRVAKHERLLDAYNRSASTLNLLRAFTKGGFADLSRVHAWTQEFVADSPAGRKYAELADGIDAALRFMRACGIDTKDDARLHEVDFYTSHEALLLGYEEALTRRDSLDRGLVRLLGPHGVDRGTDSPAGRRPRRVLPRHQEPGGMQTRSDRHSGRGLALCEALNPERIPGRLTLITRMGAERVAETLPPLLEAVRDAEHPVVWACDPMHGNTFTSNGGRKTRHLEDVMREIDGFFAAHRAAGTWPGGIHLELTGDDVTECLGGAHEVGDSDLEFRYETMCDPRLNGRQSLDLAFRVADLLTRNR
jgi:3-deoxy-7-phosphoheptulonate synthase